MPGLESLLLARYLAANTVQASFALAAGFTATDPDTADHRVVRLGVDGDGKRNLGAEITFFGVGANDTTYAYRIYTVHRGRETDAWELRLFYSGSVTLGTHMGPAGGSIANDSDRFADTFAGGTVGAWATAVANANGSSTPVEHSPADNTIAHLKIPDFGGAWGFLIEFDMTGATSGNALVEIIT